MSQVIKLDSGVIRSDLPMADGRTIRYYDSAPHTRTASDTRPVEDQPGIGELRLDPLLNEWVRGNDSQEHQADDKGNKNVQ